MQRVGMHRTGLGGNDRNAIGTGDDLPECDAVSRPAALLPSVKQHQTDELRAGQCWRLARHVGCLRRPIERDLVSMHERVFIDWQPKLNDLWCIVSLIEGNTMLLEEGLPLSGFLQGIQVEDDQVNKLGVDL